MLNLNLLVGCCGSMREKNIYTFTRKKKSTNETVPKENVWMSESVPVCLISYVS